MGAPNKKPLTKRDYERVRRLVANGYTRQSIATELGMSIATFYRWIDKDDKLKESLTIGKAQDFQAVINKAREKAIEGSYQHMSGYLRVIHNVDMSGDSGASRGNAPIVVNINLGQPESKEGLIIDQVAERITKE